MTTCPTKCEVCNGSIHHWVDNATGNDGDPTYACKHCDALGETCDTCGGCDRPDDFECPECDGDGIVELTSPVVTFKFVEFNHRRHGRGVEAARVEVLEDGEPCALLWMSERDVKLNIAEFGDSEDLQKALAQYARHRRRK